MMKMPNLASRVPFGQGRYPKTPIWVRILFGPEGGMRKHEDEGEQASS
jgi:hypothetical protein